MLQLASIGPMWTFLLLVSLAASASWGITHVCKLAIAGWMKRHPGKLAPWFWDASLRLISCISGAIVGFLLMQDMVGLFTGFGAGALNTMIVWALRRRIRRLAEAEDESDTETETDE